MSNCENCPNEDELEGDSNMDDEDTDSCSDADQKATNNECYDGIDNNQMLLAMTVTGKT